MTDRSTYFSKKVLLLNVVLTFFIVWLHSVPVIRCGIPLQLESYPLIYSIHLLSVIAVPIFFFLSGMLMYRSCSFDNLLHKLKSRVFSLLIPYILWNTLYVLFYFTLGKISFLGGSLNNSYEFDSVKSFIIAILDGRFSDLWFIKYLLYFLIVSPIVLLVLRNIYVSIAVLLLVLIGAFYQDFSYWSLLTWFFVYFAGAILGKFYYTKNREDISISKFVKANYKLLVKIVLLAVFIVIAVFSICYSSVVPLLWLSSPFFIWVLFDMFFENYIQTSFVSKKWMTYTFFIFCSHHLVVNILQKIIFIYLPRTNFTFNIVFILTPFIVFLMLIFVANFLSRFWFYKYLSGGR